MAVERDGAPDRGGIVTPEHGGGRRRPAPPAIDRRALRVVAGSARGRRLDAPGGTAIRPTSERVREATFNALDSLGAVDGARVVDAFAGSGALGIEALSRGADHVTFVESDASARVVIEANLASIGFEDRSRVVGGDGIAVATSMGPWDLVLLDPPYVFDRWHDALVAVRTVLVEEGIVVIESGGEVPLPAGLHPLRTKTYSGTVVTFASPLGAPS